MVVAAFAVALWVLVPGVRHAAIYTVTNTNDSGTGSLREAIGLSNAILGLDTIATHYGEPYGLDWRR